MLTISGIYYRKGKRVDESFFNDIKLNSHFPDELNENFFDKNVALAGSPSVRPQFGRTVQYNNSGLAIAGDAILYNKDELISRLGISLGAGYNDQDIILKAYENWGEECVKYFSGDFAFAIWDAKSQTMFCARDHMGHVPFYYYLDENTFFFSNHIQLLAAFSFANELDEDWIRYFFQRLTVSKNSTIYKNIKRLPPGHTISIGVGKAKIDQYWYLEAGNKSAAASVAEATEGLRWHLENAVKQRVKDAGICGVELSGGIDSTVLAALAQKDLSEQDKNLRAFTNILPHTHKEYFDGFTDEWERSSLVAAHIGISSHKGISKPLLSPLEMLEKILEIRGYPTILTFANYQQAIYASAQKMNVDTLISGFGGNELLTEMANTRYIHELSGKGRLFTLSKYFQSFGDNLVKSVMRAGYHWVRYLSQTEKRVYRKFAELKWKELILRNELLNDEVVKEFYLERAAYPVNQTLRERSIYRVYSGIGTERLETGYQTTSAYGIKYKYPLLDKNLMEYYFNLPDEWKVASENSRSLFRAATKDLLPEVIIKQPKYRDTSTVPFYKVEIHSNFEKLKSHCLNLPNGNKVFDYVDKKKIADLHYGKDIRVAIRYDFLLWTAFIAMFIDKMRDRKLNEL